LGEDMTHKEVKKLIRDYLYCIKDCPLRAVDCNQEKEEELRFKLMEYVRGKV